MWLWTRVTRWGNRVSWGQVACHGHTANQTWGRGWSWCLSPEPALLTPLPTAPTPIPLTYWFKPDSAGSWLRKVSGFSICSPFQIVNHSPFFHYFAVLSTISTEHTELPESFPFGEWLSSPQLFADPVPPPTGLPQEATTEDTAGSFDGKTQTLMVKWDHLPNLCPRAEILSPKSLTNSQSPMNEGKLRNLKQASSLGNYSGLIIVISTCLKSRTLPLVTFLLWT